MNKKEEEEEPKVPKTEILKLIGVTIITMLAALKIGDMFRALIQL